MDVQKTMVKSWKLVLNTIFPSGIPLQCEWNHPDQIIDVLNSIGSISNSNHMFYPSGGGMDIKSASKSNEKDCIEINTGLIDILKPSKLIFQSFDEILWSYFYLETLPLQPTGIYKPANRLTEELIESTPGQYDHIMYYELGEKNGEKLPETARRVTRHLSGAFVIFSKASPYNRHSSTYDARHNKYNAEQFKDYIENVIKNGWKE